MNCPFCNEEISATSKYCINCGKEIIKEEKHVPKCFDVFATLGFWIGIVSLILGLFFGYGLFFVEHGIVFSALGKRSIKNKRKANFGLIISIISLIFNIIMVIVSWIIFVLFLVYLTYPRLK